MRCKFPIISRNTNEKIYKRTIDEMRFYSWQPEKALWWLIICMHPDLPNQRSHKKAVTMRHDDEQYCKWEWIEIPIFGGNSGTTWSIILFAIFSVASILALIRSTKTILLPVMLQPRDLQMSCNICACKDNILEGMQWKWVTSQLKGGSLCILRMTMWTARRKKKW